VSKHQKSYVVVDLAGGKEKMVEVSEVDEIM
jgi:hypothetical protein